MIDLRRKTKSNTCKICHKKKRKLSARGLCEDCSKNRNVSAIFQMRAKEGPVYEKWKKNLRSAILGES